MDLLMVKELIVFAGFGVGLWLSLMATAIYYGGTGYALARKRKRDRFKHL